MASKKKPKKKPAKRRSSSKKSGGKTKVVTTSSKTTVVTKMRNGVRKLKWKRTEDARGRKGRGRGFYTTAKGGVYVVGPEKGRWSATFSRRGSMTIHDVRPKKSLGIRTHASMAAAKLACELHASRRPTAAAQRRTKAGRARSVHNRNFWGD